MLLNFDTIPHIYKNYVKQIEETDLLQALRISGHRMVEVVHSIPVSKQDFRYADGKWSVRELLCHIIDADRIFAYRALRFARNDKTPLEGFEENDYAPQANAHNRSLSNIADEMALARQHHRFIPKFFTRYAHAQRGSEQKRDFRNGVGVHHCGARDAPPQSACGALPNRKKMRLTILLLLLAACSPALKIKKEIRRVEEAQQDHVGFLLLDPVSKKNIIQHNDARYFTPASNTKIFTLYTSIKLLGDSLRAFEYIQRNDTTILWGLADPSFLNPLCYNNINIFKILQGAKGKLVFSPSNFNTTALGNGWSWDDYNYSYSAERTPFPIYGNLITVKKVNNALGTEPKFFEEHLVTSPEKREYEEVLRDVDDNQLVYYRGEKEMKQKDVPFHFSGDLLADLLSDTLKRQVEFANIKFQKGTVVKSLHVDSVLRVMMQDSDNMMAEQLLLQCAAVVSDTLQPEIAIRYATENLLSTLPDKPQWVDGSGLSRFNLFTPRSIAHVWQKLYQEVPRERLFRIVAVGGQSGTLKNHYHSTPPFIFGKTGTLSNNHSLSGFLITKKGKTLIFSWMNNNFVNSTSVVRKEMEKILTRIRDHY